MAKQIVKNKELADITEFHQTNDGVTGGKQFIVIKFADNTEKTHEVTDEQYTEFAKCFERQNWQYAAKQFYTATFAELV